MNGALWGVLAGGGIALASRLLEWGLRREERKAEVREKRRTSAAASAGPAVAALRALEPRSMITALRGSPEAPGALRQRWAEWVSAQGGLEILAAAHPGSEVADLCEVVIEGGTDLLKKLTVAVVDGETQRPEWWTAVESLWTETIGKAQQLVRAVLDQPA